MNLSVELFQHANNLILSKLALMLSTFTRDFSSYIKRSKCVTDEEIKNQDKTKETT